MTNKKIGLLQISTITFFLVQISFILFFNNITTISKNDTIISIIIGFSLDLLLFKLILKIRKNIKFSKNKIIRFAIAIILTIILLFLVFNSAKFIKDSFLASGNIYSIIILLLLTSIIASSDSYKQVASLSLILFFIFVPLFCINVIGSSFNLDLSYLTPPLTTNIFDITKGGLLFCFYTITPLLLLLFIPYNDIDQKKKQDKYLYLALIISILVIIVKYLLLYLSCSINIINSYNYPYMLVINALASNLVFDRFSYIISFYLLFDQIIITSLLIASIKQLLCYKYNQAP